MSQTYTPPVDLGFLSSLGFSPESPLMNDPRLLVDGRFLAAVMLELENELGRERSHVVFYQIGLFHGLRDAHRLVQQNLDQRAVVGQASGPRATPLAISLGPRRTATDRPSDSAHAGDSEAPAAGASAPEAALDSIEISGEWPEAYEAQTRLSGLGLQTLPSCWLSAGYTAGWLSASFDGDMVVIETECAARGDEKCRFISLDAETCRRSDNYSDAPLVDASVFDAFRIAATSSSAAPDELQEGPLDLGEPAVHVWGPVMILPFTQVDQALRTVEMLGRDADTSDVRAVVLDLRSAPLDEGGGLIALERVLEYIEAWGAEAILTGVAELSEEVVGGLETERLLIRRDMSEAIAVAFQIAEAQRHLL